MPRQPVRSSEDVTKEIKGSDGRGTACGHDLPMMFRPHKPTCKSHVCTFLCLVLRTAQTSHCTWRGAWLLPTALRGPSGGPPHRYFLWPYRQEWYWKSCPGAFLSAALCSWHLRSSWISSAIAAAVSALSFRSALAPKFAGSPQSWGCELLLCVASARCHTQISFSSATPTPKLLFEYYLSHPFLTHVSASNNCQLSFRPSFHIINLVLIVNHSKRSHRIEHCWSKK